MSTSSRSAGRERERVTSLLPIWPGTNTTVPGFFLDKETIPKFLAYKPQDDPDSRYLRSRVPLASRIPTFDKTQAQPKIDPRPWITQLSQMQMPVVSDYDRYLDGKVYQATDVLGDKPQEFQFHRYGSSNDVFAYHFYQYYDILGTWTPHNDSPVVIPSFGCIDAAHRNGVKVLGVILNPYVSDNDDCSFTVKSGDRFLVGDKLVELATYFGYDGYFLNFEYPDGISKQQAELIQSLLVQMKERSEKIGGQPLYLEWYDSMLTSGETSYQNELNKNNLPWLNLGLDSIFLNYWWSQPEVNTSAENAEKNRIDPYWRVFFGLETEQADSPPGDPNKLLYRDGDVNLVTPPNGSGKGRAGLALFDPVQSIVRWGRKKASDEGWTGLGSVREIASYIHEVERRLWSGGSGNPAFPPRDPAAFGVASYIAERSPIGSFPFVTRFNTGVGDRFFLNGEATYNKPWFNVGIQDVLPTWQWLTKNYNDNQISNSVEVGYDFDSAYNGGCSVCIKRTNETATPSEIRLFKTRFLIAGAGEQVTITYKLSPGAQLSMMMIGFIFEGDSNIQWQQLTEVTTKSVANKALDDGWRRASYELGVYYKSRVLAAISLAVGGPAKYSVNIGELALTDAQSRGHRVPTPSGFKIKKSLLSADKRSAQLRVEWNFDPNVWYYDIFRRQHEASTDNMMWLGRISGDAYYIESIPRLGSEQTTVLQLVAVTPAGTAEVHPGATARFDWTSS